MPQGTTAAEKITVFTATNRGAEDGRPTEARSDGMAFAALAVAVPPMREAGGIATPEGRAPDPATDFLLSDVRPLADAEAFRAALGRDLRSRPASARDVVIYVHGFNTTFSEGVLRIAQLSHDLNLDATAVHFAWPSVASPLAYERDRASALYSRDALERVIRLTRAAGARRVILVAHSMGGFLAMETLRQMAIARPGSVAREVQGVVLISPDIDVDVFRSQARRIGKLPETFAIFVSERDRALRLAARLTGETARLGNLEDPSRIADLEVTLIDVSNFEDDSLTGHFVPGTAPELVELLSRAGEVGLAFDQEISVRSGLLPGSILTIQNVTELVLLPVN